MDWAALATPVYGLRSAPDPSSRVGLPGRGERHLHRDVVVQAGECRFELPPADLVEEVAPHWLGVARRGELVSRHLRLLVR